MPIVCLAIVARALYTRLDHCGLRLRRDDPWDYEPVRCVWSSLR